MKFLLLSRILLRFQLEASIFQSIMLFLVTLNVWCIEQDLSLQQMLRFPFYHPVYEEALQSAIRDALAKMEYATDIPNELTPLD